MTPNVGQLAVVIVVIFFIVISLAAMCYVIINSCCRGIQSVPVGPTDNLSSTITTDIESNEIN